MKLENVGLKNSCASGCSWRKSMDGGGNFF